MLGSINKEFTQAAIRQLVRDGKLSLTDTLGKFFPDYPQVTSRAATVEQLLTHRGGLSDFFGPEFNKAAKDRLASNADYFNFVSGLAPAFAPGERNQYCNGCYIALGYTRREGDGALRSNLAMHGVTGSAAGGGYSTAFDLLTYVLAVRAGRFPGVEPGIGIAGGAPGINAVLESRGDWVVIVLTNFDPPTGERIGIALADAVAR
jgi:hypothetical protein